MRTTNCLRFLASILLLALLGSTALADNPSHIIPYIGAYDAQTYPPSDISSDFSSVSVSVDGFKDDCYQNAWVIPAVPNGNASAMLSTCWNGTQLFLYIEVDDVTVQRGTTVDDALDSTPARPANCDSVTIGIDLYNDKVVYETDTIGTFNIDANGMLHYYRNNFIPSLGSVMADPIHPEYQNRIASVAAADRYDANGVIIGYAIEAAIHIENLNIGNGTVFGLEVQVNDAASIDQVSLSENEVLPDGASSRVIAQTFLSHRQMDIYEVINDSSPNCVDWANLTLIGWNGADAFAPSTWRLSNALRYLDSIAFAKDVYTSDSQAALDSARAAAESVLESGTLDMAHITPAADALDAAISGLRWRDTRYPDPYDLPNQMTLPNPYRFFQSDNMVSSLADWANRRAELLDMAQFYEYGYKPGAPESAVITNIEHFDIGDVRKVLYWGFWEVEVPIVCPTDVITLQISDHGRSSSLDFVVYRPTEEQLAAAGHQNEKIPVLLSYDGLNEAYLNAGIAVVEIPAGSSGDIRTNEYAWGERSGTFYELYPYARNGEGALHEISSEMAAAWSATRVIDALETLDECTLAHGSEIASLLDPAKLAVSGSSINGKYAFVAALFDERIDICIPSAAGASGPSPWRYVYTGHIYDWSNTPFAPKEEQSSSAIQTAFGTETLGNSIRHNRVRETELFRKFLTPHNFYQRLEGAYGFGTRLPYDQTDLIATLAPRAIVLVNTVNDCNDGSEADALGLEVAKSIYTTLGYDAEDLIRFNYRGVQDGEPHGMDTVQYERNAAYIQYYFNHVPLDPETDAWLRTNPFMLPVCNGENPFDFYYGGFNTITGGDDNTAGWYSYRFEK